MLHNQRIFTAKRTLRQADMKRSMQSDARVHTNTKQAASDAPLLPNDLARTRRAFNARSNDFEDLVAQFGFKAWFAGAATYSRRPLDAHRLALCYSMRCIYIHAHMCFHYMIPVLRVGSHVLKSCRCIQIWQASSNSGSVDAALQALS